MNKPTAETLLAPYIAAVGSQKYTLERMTNLMAALGNPQNQLRVIHVAGTSGKTSTCYYLAALLKASGKTVGLTISPHMSSVRERVQINLHPLPEQLFYDELSAFLTIVDSSGIQPSYFELLVALAYWYFAKVGVDYAVIEVGLGGLLDATNVVGRPDKVCVITDIGLDHTHVLGKTLPEIARQKAGIITAHNQVFMHPQDPSVMNVVTDATAAVGGTLHIIGEGQYPTLPLFQQRNYSLAAAVVTAVLGQTIPEEQAAEARRVHIPGRLEVFEHAGKQVILDGAHNAQKLAALFASLAERYPAQPITAVVAMSEREPGQVRDGLTIVLDHAAACILTTYNHSQDISRLSVPLSGLQQAVSELGSQPLQAINSAAAALEVACGLDNPLLVVTGSLYLVAELRAQLQPAAPLA